MITQFKNTLFCTILFSLFLIGCNDKDEIAIPLDVSNFTAVAGAEKVTLTWSKSTDPNLKEYWLTIHPLVMDAFPIDKNLDTYTVENLPGGIEYTFTLLVKNQSGGASKGISASATPSIIDRTATTEVTNLSAVSSDKKIILNWTKPADADLAGYELTYQPGGGIVNLGKDIQTYTIENLTNDIEYTIVLKAKDETNNISQGTSIKATPSIPDSVPPAEVTGIDFVGAYVAPGQGSTFTISWTIPSDSDFQECELTYSYGSGIPATKVIIPKTRNSFTVTDGMYNNYYTLILKTKDASGNFSTGVTKKIRFGNFIPTVPTMLTNFDPEIVAIIAGKLNINGFTIAISLDKLSNLEHIDGKLEITSNNSATNLTNLDAFQKLKKVAGTITITNNTSLSDFCGLKNLFSVPNQAPGSYTVSGNAANPTKQDIIDNCP